MDNAELIEVIRTTLLRKGSGRKDDPIRIITQYWTKDGQLLAQIDPCHHDTLDSTLCDTRKDIKP